MWRVQNFLPATRESICRRPRVKSSSSLGFGITREVNTFSTTTGLSYDCGGGNPERFTIPNLGFHYRYNLAGFRQQPIQRTFVSEVNNKNKDGTSVDPSTKDTSNEIQIPGAQQGGRKLAIIFTCVHCNTRSAKQFTERSYRHGVVIATCPGCKRRHLIADNLGYFSDEEDGGWNIEKGMAKLGENVRVATNDDVLELTVEDIYTKEVIEAAIENATGDLQVPPPDIGKKS